jgi:uncharacterized membrane protein
MRRRMRNVPKAKNKALVYTCALLAIGVYGVPRIPGLYPGLAGTFSMVWILFAVLALAANVYFLVGADRERSRMLETYEMKGSSIRDVREEDARTRHRQAY